MKSARILAITTSCVLAVNVAHARDRVFVEIKHDSISHGTTAILTNSSNRAICVNDDIWRSDDSYMSLYDKSGRAIAKITFREIRPTDLNGLDTSRPYRVLPGQSQYRYALDDRVFDAPPGMYQVRLRVEYYFCEELLLALQGRGTASVHEIDVRGEMETFGRFWKCEHCNAPP